MRNIRNIFIPYLIIYIDVHTNSIGFAGYQLAESGFNSNCSGDGLADVSSEAECFNATIDIEHTYYRIGSWKTRSKGCLMEGNNIYWNKLSTAKAQGRFQKICKAGKFLQVICFTYSIYLAQIF